MLGVDRNVQLLSTLSRGRRERPAPPPCWPKVHVVGDVPQPLRRSAEREYAVPPLMLPDRVTSASIEWLMRSEAAQLFFEQARAVKPDFAVVPDTAAEIAEICS